MTAGGLIDHCDIMCGSLIVLHPAAVQEVQLAPCHQALYRLLRLRCLLLPPAAEEGLWSRSAGVGRRQMNNLQLMSVYLSLKVACLSHYAKIVYNLQVACFKVHHPDSDWHLQHALLRARVKGEPSRHS